jgi:DnaJ-class molecular chaperone
MSQASDQQMNPGDEAPSGTPGTGEDICPVCGGKGKNASGADCPNCGGTGKIVEGVGGG